MEFRVLGSLEVRDQDTVVDLGSPRTRLMCGLLLVRPGGLVTVEQFVDELWPEGRRRTPARWCVATCPGCGGRCGRGRAARTGC